MVCHGQTIDCELLGKCFYVDLLNCGSKIFAARKCYNPKIHLYKYKKYSLANYSAVIFGEWFSTGHLARARYFLVVTNAKLDVQCRYCRARIRRTSKRGDTVLYVMYSTNKGSTCAQSDTFRITLTIIIYLHVWYMIVLLV